jgi:O-acetyl-ADP-ribose deacetylase (regulator of RNase III)
MIRKNIVIEFRKGNLFEAGTEALVNAVNTEGVMGKGIALQFKLAFPEMFVSYREACASGELCPGTLHVFDRGEASTPRYIINFPTKRSWRAKSRLTDIESGLIALGNMIRERRFRSIAIPALGCGLGGLDWEQVRSLIEFKLAEISNVTVLVFEP